MQVTLRAAFGGVGPVGRFVSGKKVPCDHACDLRRVVGTYENCDSAEESEKSYLEARYSLLLNEPPNY